MGAVHTMKRLVVMRHAKAEPYAATDHQRALTARGHDDAAAAGRWLREQVIAVDHALVSAARRTRETWDDVAQAADWLIEPTIDESLYGASPDSALDLIRLVPESAACLLVVGHNPTMAMLASLLADGEGDAAALDAMTAGFPTSALMVFEIATPWADLEYAGARAVAFHVGRG